MKTLFLDALLGKKIKNTPIWLMRQAGRYLPEYCKIRANFNDFMTMCRHSEACCEIALQPLNRFDLDAAILFSDILTVPEAMGMTIRFIDGKGPVFSAPLKNASDIKNLDVINYIERLNYVFDTISITKKALGQCLPLIGFCGSPWTLAAYMIEGKHSKQFIQLRKIMYSAPNMLHSLLMKLANVSQTYLLRQIKAGVDAIMIFDTWGGLLSAGTYWSFSLYYIKQIIHEIKHIYPHIPVILFTKGGGLWIEQMANAGCDGLSLDWTIDMQSAYNIVHNKVTLQGNLDPAVLYGDSNSIQAAVKKILLPQTKNSRYIFNLGHGIYPDISATKVKIMVDAVRKFGQKSN